MAKTLHIKNLEKYHPGYKDRHLIWCKLYFSMLDSDNDFEMLEEIDKWRFIAFIVMELKKKEPILLDEQYLIRKGFDFKKKSLQKTLDALSPFVDVCNKMLQNVTECNGSVTDFNNPVTQNRVDYNRVDYNKLDNNIINNNIDTASNVPKITPIILTQLQILWNDTCLNLSKVISSSKSREAKEKTRLREMPVEKWKEVFTRINQSDFCCGKNEQKWKASYDWIINNDTNVIKTLEGKYDNRQETKKAEIDWDKLIEGRSNKGFEVA